MSDKASEGSAASEARELAEEYADHNRWNYSDCSMFMPLHAGFLAGYQTAQQNITVKQAIKVLEDWMKREFRTCEREQDAELDKEKTN